MHVFDLASCNVKFDRYVYDIDFYIEILGLELVCFT